MSSDVSVQSAALHQEQIENHLQSISNRYQKEVKQVSTKKASIEKPTTNSRSTHNIQDEGGSRNNSADDKP